MRKPRSGGKAQVFRITGARQGLEEDVRGRQRRYVISMSIRTVSVILADSLNVVDLLNADAVLIEQPALARMEEVYA